MDLAGWISALQWPLTFVAISVVMGWLARGRMQARPPAQSRRLAQPPTTLIFGVVCFAFFTFLLAILYSNPTATWWTNTVFATFALLGAASIALYFTDHHDVSDTELTFTTILGARKRISWADISRIRYAHLMKWFRVESRSGVTARISAMLMGLPEFARTALERAPESAIDADTREILRMTAAGQPPPLH